MATATDQRQGPGTPLLEARDLNRAFGSGATAVEALRGVSLTVRELKALTYE